MGKKKKNIMKEYEKGTTNKKKKVFKVILFIFIIMVVIFTGILSGVLLGIFGNAEKLTKADFTIKDISSHFYDKDGNEVAVIHNGTNRMYIELKNTPKMLSKAFISIEDERFEKHRGMDLKRSAGAVFTYVTNGGSSSFGGSTITQQLVKNITSDKEDSPLRKIREITRAMQVETWLTKDEIMELYLNVIYLGEGTNGVQTASHNYFGKDVSELSIAECALIAGLTQSPERYNPHKNPQAAKDRQEVVLAKMKELGYITDKEYEEAKAQELVYKKGEIVANVAQSYFVEAAFDQVVEDLMKEKNISEAMAMKMVYGGGLKIYTTMDAKVQDQLEKTYTTMSNFPTQTTKVDGKNTAVQAQSATVVMDHKTGNVVGVRGGVGEKTEQRVLNRATQSYRQPGSSIKPIAVYGPGVANGTITAGTIFNDSYLKVGNYEPKNWYSGYKGLVTTRDAIEQSMNIPAVLGLQMVGVDDSIKFMQELGISSLGDEDKNLSTALGGIYKGISPLDMTAAYATFANDGVYIAPRFYSKIEDSKGKVVLEKKTEKRKVMSEQAAYVMKDLLTAPVVGSNGTGGAGKISGMIVSAKTGTTNDSKDLWYCGFTPYYVAATWYGFDQPIPINGTARAVTVWASVMKPIHSGLKSVTEYTEPSGITRVTICKQTGLIAGNGCDRKVSEVFVSGTEPTKVCNTQSTSKRVTICKDSGLLAGAYCPESSKESKTFSGSDSAPTKTCNIHTQPPSTEASDPVITGLKDQKITVGSSFNPKAGVTATDKKDGDISAKIIVSGSYNVNTPGTYTITLSVTNSSGRTATKSMKLTVESAGSGGNTTP